MNLQDGLTATVSGTLSGDGSLTGGNGAVLTGSGTLSPGKDGVGTFSASRLALEPGATYRWELGDTANDLVTVAGDLRLEGDGTVPDLPATRLGCTRSSNTAP